jgi:hypothetical protein
MLKITKFVLSYSSYEKLSRLIGKEKDLVLAIQETGLAPGPVWTGMKKLAPTGSRCPNRPARNKLL